MDKKDLSLSTPLDVLENEIMASDDADELSDIIDIFNLNLQKKNLVRNKKLNDIQDKVVERMLEKIESEPWEFSNDDLIKFHKIIQETLTKSPNIDKSEIPMIQVNQQINVNSPNFDRESRAKILSAVNDILNNKQYKLEKEEEIEEVQVLEDDK
jgi:hypothetical protein